MKLQNLKIILISLLAITILITSFVFVRSTLIGSKPNTANSLISELDNKVGNSESKVKFVYLFDYSCIYCESNAENMTKIVAEYKNKVEFVFKHFITHKGPGTRNALASMAAGKMGKYLEYHEKLIRLAKEKGGNVTANEQDELAKELGLDIEQFRKIRDSKNLQDELDSDQNVIKDLIVPPSEYAPGKLKPDGTPSTIIVKDGKVITWWVVPLPLEDIGETKGVKTRIDKILNEKQK